MPMVKISTLFIIALFSSLLAGFVAIQYSWVQIVRENRLKKFKMSMQTGIHQTVMEFAFICHFIDNPLFNKPVNEFA